MQRPSRRQFLKVGTGSVLAVGLSGCGTIMYPERRGQPSGPLDWKVVALDAVGLLFFFIPGVIAFAVDFSTGAIYLPPEEYLGTASGAPAGPLVSMTIPRSELGPEGIERAVSRHCHRPVRLVPGEYRTQPLASLDEFWRVRDALAAA